MSELMRYDWPGNVRELENAIEHAFVLCGSGLIGMECLPESFHSERKTDAFENGMTLTDTEKYAIVRALKRNNWKTMATARELGIDKNTLRRKIRRLDIRMPE
jgi:transcriptional regulator of acetoin/glycerol metabolism